MVKVSVIVPIYNGEKYIDRCMECLVQQSLQELEIVAVDDCSIDKSREVLEKWQNQYLEKIVIVDADRKLGAGGARNLGLEYAKGQYVGYMDCDDVIEPAMYEKLYLKAMEDDYDVVDCAYFDEANNCCIMPYDERCAGHLDVSKRKEIICGVGYGCTKIFRREFLEACELKVRENVIYEDLDYLVKVILCAGKVGVVNEVLYHYKNNVESSSNIEREQKKFDDMLAVIKELLSIEKNGTEEAVDFVILNCCVAAIGQCLFNQENAEFDLVNNLKSLKATMSKTNITGWKENVFVAERMPEENIELIEWFEELKL